MSETDSCYFCGSNEDIEVHHIVPRRFDGSDREGNLVDLCHECHWKLERLYNKDFWEAIGVEDPRATQESHVTCYYHSCTDKAVDRYRIAGEWNYRCEKHEPDQSKVAERHREPDERPQLNIEKDDYKSSFVADAEYVLNSILGDSPGEERLKHVLSARDSVNEVRTELADDRSGVCRIEIETRFVNYRAEKVSGTWSVTQHD